MADFETTSGITLVTDSSNHPFQRVEYSGEVEGDYAIPYVRTVDVNTGEELDRYALISESYWRYDGIQLSTNLPIKSLRGEFYGTADASPTLDNGPALIIGPRDGYHIEIDQNEILAKESATTGGVLYIGDKSGGKMTSIGGAPVNLDSTGAITANNAILLNNNLGYRIKNASGAAWNAVTLNSSNDFTFGNGSYDASAGNSYFDGNYVRLRTKQKVTVNGKAPIKYTSMEKAIGNVNAGAGWQASVVATAQSGYTCVGIIGFNMTHNQAGSVGKVILTVSSRTCSASGSNWGGNWTGTNNFHWDILWIANEFL